MRAVFGLVLVLGMGLAGFAVYMVKGYIGQTENALIAERQRTAAAVDWASANRGGAGNLAAAGWAICPQHAPQFARRDAAEVCAVGGIRAV